MIYNLTKEDVQTVFDLAHREWSQDTQVVDGLKRTDKSLVVESYFKAITAFLKSKGYKIEKVDEK